MDSGKREPDLDFVAIAQAYVDRWFPNQRRSGALALQLDGTLLHWNEDYCRQVAQWYERGPRLAYDARLSRLYDRFVWETRQQYRTIVDAGITVAPWRQPGQPYGGSAELCEAVRTTGTIYVYLTSEGHGNTPSPGYHPLRSPSGIVVDGVELAHNDLFRVVHDIFGHVMHGNTFSARGEFGATFCHMHMYSEDVHPVLFTEQVAQICWYYFGPHLRGGGQRQYPDQKVLEVPSPFLDQFKAIFAEADRTQPAGPTDT